MFEGEQRMDSVPSSETTTEPDAVVESDSLVEEVSIDGMCGVY